MPHPIRPISAVSVLTLALALAPIPVHLDWAGFGAASAYAAKNGAGGAGKSGDGPGKSGGAAGKDKAHGSNKTAADKSEGEGASDSGDDVAEVNDLGSLNAAHASDNARLHASPNSRVGRIASYEAAIQEGDVDAAATSIDAAANKTVTDRVLHAVNELLGIDDNVVEGAIDHPTVHDLEGDVVTEVAQR